MDRREKCQKQRANESCQQAYQSRERETACGCTGEVPPAQKPPASPKAKTAVDPLHELMEMLGSGVKASYILYLGVPISVLKGISIY